MTAADLIEELRRLPPHARVEMVCEQVLLKLEDNEPSRESAQYAEVGAVIWEGSYVLISP